MATKKKSVAPAAVSPIDVDSNVVGSDVVLVNRSAVDHQTTVEDLAKGVGSILNIDGLAVEIDKLSGEINSNDTDLSELEARVEKNEGDIETNADGVQANADAIAALVIGDGEIKLTEWDGTEVGKFTVNQESGATIALPQVVIPEALHPNGFINVADPAPADPVVGDIYIQHDAGTPEAKIADSSFAGLSGELVDEGAFVVFGKDDKWHAGGQAAPTETQSDWAELDVTQAAYIKNKPDIQDLIDTGAGDGALTLASTNAAIAVKKGSGFSANTAADVEYSVELDLNDEGGLVITGDGLGIQPAPDAGIIIDGNGISVDPDFIAGIAGPTPDLEAVTDAGATTPDVITVKGVVATGTQAESSFLIKDISQLPALPA